MFYGFSLTPNVLVLSEYLKNHQNLKEIMMSSVVFNWEISLKIAMEIAKAIKVLHSWKPTILIKNLMVCIIYVNYKVKVFIYCFFSQRTFLLMRTMILK